MPHYTEADIRAGAASRSVLAALVAGLTETQLRQLIVNVGAEQAGFAAAIEREVKLLPRVAPGSLTRLPLSHPSRWMSPLSVASCAVTSARPRQPAGVVSGATSTMTTTNIPSTPMRCSHRRSQIAENLLAADAAAGAAALLSAVIEEWHACLADLEDWMFEANEDSLAEAATAIDALLAESLLSQPLTETERRQWRARIDDWAEDVLGLSITDKALETWWDYPPLVAAMQGNITESGAWEGEAPDCAEELAQARLRILERQGRIAEYLNLAQAEGQLVLYLTKLVEIGEIERAVAEAIAYLGAPPEVLAVATTLADHGHPREALAVAAHGLDLDYPHGKEALAHWIAPLAEAQGDGALALRAAKTAFFVTLTLADYQVAERAAGAAWPAIKRELLDHLQQASYAHYAVDIYLYEQMLVEAMAAVGDSAYAPNLGRVVEATRADYPDWGIQRCKTQAERIMNEGKAKYYDAAVDWLRRARDIYAQHKRLAEWRPYLDALLDTHARKYKLVPMLKTLRSERAVVSSCRSATRSRIS